jgi:hypothetical protein
MVGCSPDGLSGLRTSPDEVVLSGGRFRARGFPAIAFGLAVAGKREVSTGFCVGKLLPPEFEAISGRGGTTDAGGNVEFFALNAP